MNEILRERVAEETEGRRKATPETHELDLNSVTLSKQRREPDAAAPGAWKDSNGRTLWLNNNTDTS